MTLKNNRAPLLSNIKLFASFHHHMWIQTGVTVRKRFSWVVTSVTLTFDLWPWPFAWTLLWSLVITPENFMMIRWWEHSQKGVTDGQTDRQTENTICRAAWSQLKIHASHEMSRYIREYDCKMFHMERFSTWRSHHNWINTRKLLIVTVPKINPITWKNIKLSEVKCLIPDLMQYNKSM